MIEVADLGPGLDPASRHLAFDRFQRVGSASEGSGLGLSIARRIVELHGGSIRLDANQPQGCRAVVELPAVPAKGAP